MKKLLCMILCIVLASLVLVSCEEDVIGKVPSDYPTIDKTVDEVSLNLYIIVEDETVEGGKTKAINTVNNAIKQYTSSNYHSEVNVIYVTAAEYETKVLAAVNATDATAANIVLINSYSLMQKLYATGKLCALDAYLDTSAFGRLNTVIPASLFEASKITETTLDGSKEVLYSIPNNHVIGNYEYLLIDKKIARDYFNFNETKLTSYKSYEDAAELINVIETDGTYNVTDCVSVVSGSYDDRAKYIAEGYYCNIIKSPKADVNTAFSSAFAIINRDALHNERAMQIIYAINTDIELRNTLQYGVKGTNYSVEYDYDEAGEPIESTLRVIRDTSDNNLYYMNLTYTGNVFNAYYCEEIDWTEAVKASGNIQNSEATFK